MRKWFNGIPNEPGHYWLRLSPNKVIKDVGNSKNICCYAAISENDRSVYNMDSKFKTHIEKGDYSVTGYILLPES